MPTLIPIQYQTSSEALFERLRNLPYACWLDSGRPQSKRGRYDIITALPQQHLVSHIDNGLARTDISILNLQATGYTNTAISGDCPFQLLEQALNQLNTDCNDHTIPFAGGALGYWGYELGAHIMNVPMAEHERKTLPDMSVGIYHWALIQDHERKAAYIAHLESCEPCIIEQITTRLNQPPPAPNTFKSQAITAKSSATQYAQHIEDILDYIAAGDCYQVNYAQEFTGSYEGDPYYAYQHLRQLMGSPYSAYINLGQDCAILSLSPERFIQVHNNEVLTQPIKGTAARHKDPSLDKQVASELQESEKNRAENVMIVDLLRNDIGKHCQAGSIRVPELFTLKSYPNVHHLVSSITGTLAPTSSSLDLLRDSLPGGSITGAPKKRAMEIIHELEQARRGIYCGSIGYINHNGDMDTNIAIRTVSCNSGQLSCWGGGGIVADSNASDEYQETLNKVGMILKGLEAQ